MKRDFSNWDAKPAMAGGGGLLHEAHKDFSYCSKTAAIFSEDMLVVIKNKS